MTTKPCKIVLQTILCLSVLNGSDTFSQNIFNILDFGAVADGVTLNTHTIQSVIDACHQNGGGRVILPSGRYLTGTLVLKDNVYLEILAGATLLGSKDIDDYGDQDPKVLIYADKAHDLGILGPGYIDGQGDSFWRGKARPFIRPERTIHLENCENVLIRDLALRNSAAFNIALTGCNRVTVTGCSIINEREAPNTDGIDPISSANVFISDCYIETGDDAICLKSKDPQKPCENLVVTNCVLISDDSAIKCGTASAGAIRHGTFSNIVIRDTRYGISFFMKDGGRFEDIQFSNISIETTREGLERPQGTNSYAVFMDIEKRNPQDRLGVIRNIMFSDINIETVDANCVFLGMPDQKIADITLDHVRMRVTGRTDLSLRHKPRGTRSLTDVAINDYSNRPAHFIFAHLHGLKIRDLTIQDETGNDRFERSSVWGKDVTDFSLDGFRNRQTVMNHTLPVLRLENCRQVLLRNSEPDASATPFVSLLGGGTADITVRGNDLSRIRNPIAVSEQADRRQIFTMDNRIK